MQMTPEGQPIVGPRQYKTPKTMSGGERSFTTVSLLLAMWDLSNSPMRCLDEWDVFLDPANRSVAAKMLVGPGPSWLIEMVGSADNLAGWCYHVLRDAIYPHYPAGQFGWP
jgi:hypothetical protein